MADSPDIPFGVIGRLFGLVVPEPAFEEGEEVRWEVRANHFQAKIRAVGGRLYLTNRRLIFTPTKFEKRIRGRLWIMGLADLDSATVGSMRFIRLLAKDGSRQRFVVYEKEAVVEKLNAAIHGTGQ